MTEKAIQKTKPQEIGTFLNNSRKQLEAYATRDYEMKSFLTTAMIAIENDENLTKCLQTPEGQTSLYNAMKRAASTGLSLNPLDGEACIVAYEGKSGWMVSYQVMKNGFIELAYDTGKVETIVADVVREHDEFEIEKTNGKDTYSHVPARKDRGEVDGYYAVMILNDGRSFVEYMTAGEVEEHALKYSAQYARYVNSDGKGNVPTWVKSKSAMGLKTVIKQMLRKNRISSASGGAVHADDDGERQILNITPDNPEKQKGDMI